MSKSVDSLKVGDIVVIPNKEYFLIKYGSLEDYPCGWSTYMDDMFNSKCIVEEINQRYGQNRCKVRSIDNKGLGKWWIYLCEDLLNPKIEETENWYETLTMSMIKQIGHNNPRLREIYEKNTGEKL